MKEWGNCLWCIRPELFYIATYFILKNIDNNNWQSTGNTDSI